MLVAFMDLISPPRPQVLIRVSYTRAQVQICNPLGIQQIIAFGFYIGNKNFSSMESKRTMNDLESFQQCRSKQKN